MSGNAGVAARELARIVTITPKALFMDASIIRQLRKIVGNEAVLDRPEELMLYEYDAGVDKGRPGAVVMPQNTEQVSRVMRLAYQHKLPVVPRRAGTRPRAAAI